MKIILFLTALFVFANAEELSLSKKIDNLMEDITQRNQFKSEKHQISELEPQYNSVIKKYHNIVLDKKGDIDESSK